MPRKKKWPPLTVFVCVDGISIYHVYKAQRSFPMEFWFTDTPDGTEGEGDGPDLSFDVRDLPAEFLQGLDVDFKSGEEFSAGFKRMRDHHRQAVTRAIKGGHNFMAHQNAVNYGETVKFRQQQFLQALRDGAAPMEGDHD